MAAPSSPAAANATMLQLEQRQKRTVCCLSAAVFLQYFTATLTQQAQIAVGLSLSGGDRGIVIARMAQMQSAAAALQFFTNPLCGKISDHFGRKPVLVASNFFSGVFRLSVVLYPSWFTLSLIKILGMNWSNAFRTSLDASLSDVFEGSALAVASANVKMWQGVTMLMAPVIGGRLTQTSMFLPFVLSSAIALITSSFLALSFTETAPIATPQQQDDAAKSASCSGLTGSSSARGGGGLVAMLYALPSPLDFVALFRHGRQLALLTVSAGLHSVCEFGPHSVDRHFATEFAGMGYAAEGYYSSARGLTIVIAGRLVRPTLQRLGLRCHLLLGNASCVLSQLLKAGARGPLMMYGSLLPFITGGFNFRTSPLLALHTKHALAAGLARGEVAAARSNFEALFKIVSPQVFGGTYNFFRQRAGGQWAGAPYLICGGVALIAHVLSDLALSTPSTGNGASTKFSGDAPQGRSTDPKVWSK